MEIEILIGISGSGKSTYALNKVETDHNWIRLNRDSLREMMFGTRRGYYDRKDLNECEKAVSEMVEQSLYDALHKGKNVILDNTHLKMNYIKEIIRKFNHLADISLNFFDMDEEEAGARVMYRDKLNLNDVAYIAKQHDAYLKLKKMLHGNRFFYPQVDATISFSKDNPQAVIVDLDGTLADNSHRSPFDETKVSEDKLIHPVAEIVKALDARGYYIVFVSGRSYDCEEGTVKWLFNNDLWGWGSALHMRKVGDTRPDYIVKEEIIESLASQYNVVAWIDDRLSVSREAHRLGIFCLNVNQGFKQF